MAGALTPMLRRGHFRHTSYPHAHPWDVGENRAPGENPSTHGENGQTTHSSPSWESIFFSHQCYVRKDIERNVS